MPLVTPPAPPDAEQAFRQGIGSFLAGPELDSDLKHQAFIGGAPKLPALADVIKSASPPQAPLQNFTLGLRDLQRAGGTRSAKAGSWRFFAGNTASEAVAGECLQSLDTGTWQLTNVSYGSNVWQMIEALNALPQLAGIPSLEDFKIRYLKIPGILVEAFWLVSLNGSADLAVVFPPPPNQLQRRLNDQAVYEMPVFLDIVSALAVERLKFSARKGS
jgi:hypothetical protein